MTFQTVSPLYRSASRLSRFSLIAIAVTSMLLIAAATPAFAADKPRLTLDEFFNAVDFTRVELSSDGHMVVIATSRADWKAQRFREDLWLWRDSDGLLIPLTQSGHDSDPKWSPDGKWIAFLSDRDAQSDDPDDDSESKKGATHLYLIPVYGGEAFPVTRGAEDVHTFAWGPDSKTLYFSTRVPWTSKQKDEYKDHWKDVVRYREQERGDVISRIEVADALKRQIELGTQETKKSKKDKKKAKERRGRRNRRDSRRPGSRDLALSREEHGHLTRRRPSRVRDRQRI